MEIFISAWKDLSVIRFHHTHLTDSQISMNNIRYNYLTLLLSAVRNVWQNVHTDTVSVRAAGAKMRTDIIKLDVSITGHMLLCIYITIPLLLS